MSKSIDRTVPSFKNILTPTLFKHPQSSVCGNLLFWLILHSSQNGSRGASRLLGQRSARILLASFFPCTYAGVQQGKHRQIAAVLQGPRSAAPRGVRESKRLRTASDCLTAISSFQFFSLPRLPFKLTRRSRVLRNEKEDAKACAIRRTKVPTWFAAS
jgi:hypothetical protein